jgi:hypothetical protein
MPSTKTTPTRSRRLLRSGLYCSLAPIQHTEFKGLNRAIGVWVDKPYTHKGMSDEQYVDIEFETPKFLDSSSFGKAVPVSQWKSKAREYTLRIIQHIDTGIAELQAHRERLSKELEQLDANVEPAPIPDRLWLVRQTHQVEFVIAATDADTARDNAHASVGAVDANQNDVWCGQKLAPNVVLVDFDATLTERNTLVEPYDDDH